MAALSNELSDRPLVRMICGLPIVLYRCESGAPAPIKDHYLNRQAPLSMGNLAVDTIQCNYHGFLFDGDGGCVYIRQQVKVPSAMHIRALTAVERWGFV